VSVSTLVVTDTSCLIALDRIGHFDLLQELFTVLAPPAVVAEFGRKPAWLTVRPVPDTTRVTELLEVIDRGEAEAIALALTIPDAELLIDEARGRKVARGLGLQVTGTAGVLLEAKRQGQIAAVRPLLDALIREHGFHLSEQLYAHIVGTAGEA
jgi:predicted nucleic acid-binding protein